MDVVCRKVEKSGQFTIACEWPSLPSGAELPFLRAWPSPAQLRCRGLHGTPGHLTTPTGAPGSPPKAVVSAGISEEASP